MPSLRGDSRSRRYLLCAFRGLRRFPIELSDQLTPLNEFMLPGKGQLIGTQKGEDHPGALQVASR